MHPNKSPYTFKAAMYRQRILLGVMLTLVLVVLPLGFIVSVSAAGYALSSLLFLVALLRLVLDAEVLGGLVVRRKWVDILILCSLAVAILSFSGSPNL